MAHAEQFSIRQMVELTGISEFTIRGWENRYSAFSPKRGENGRRSYSKTDIERALLLRELLKRGHKISRIAGLTHAKLKSLFEQSEIFSDEKESDNRGPKVDQALELMALQKWSDLEELIRNVTAKNVSELVQKFFLPALQLLSVKANEGLVSISQEHVFSSFIKEKIYSSLSKIDASQRNRKISSKRRFILATPEGDHHETGLLLAHLLIRSKGYTSLYLGPHTPSRDLAETALRFNASYILVVSTISRKSGARQDVLAYVSDLQKKVGPQVCIFVAGHQAPASLDTGNQLSVLGDFKALESLLEDLGD